VTIVSSNNVKGSCYGERYVRSGVPYTNGSIYEYEPSRISFSGISFSLTTNLCDTFVTIVLPKFCVEDANLNANVTLSVSYINFFKGNGNPGALYPNTNCDDAKQPTQNPKISGATSNSIISIFKLISLSCLLAILIINV